MAGSCSRRWSDYKTLQMDAHAQHLYQGPSAKFTGEQFSKLLRERWLLFVGCVESAPGKEPTSPYLYP